MNRWVILTLMLCASAPLYAGPRLHAFLVPDRAFAVLLIGALFYCGFKWRAR